MGLHMLEVPSQGKAVWIGPHSLEDRSIAVYTCESTAMRGKAAS